MTDLLLPIGFAIFVWWFATGIVLLLDGLPRTTFRWSHLLSTLLALGAFVGLAHTASQDTPAGVFCAFTSALLVWGWHELSFLTGWVTGPRRIAASAGVRGWPRFVQAVQAILWHELAILGSGAVIAVITWDAPNLVGLHTFLVLWVMRISAKLNVFLGVRNLSVELLPAHLVYMGSYFRRRAMNLLFPFAVVGATVVAVLVVGQALSFPAGSAGSAGGLLVATLLVLGILEHWLLVLPIEATALWRWALQHSSRQAARRPARQPRVTSSRQSSRQPARSVPAAPAALAAPPIEADEKLLHAR